MSYFVMFVSRESFTIDIDLQIVLGLDTIAIMFIVIMKFWQSYLNNLLQYEGHAYRSRHHTIITSLRGKHNNMSRSIICSALQWYVETLPAATTVWCQHLFSYCRRLSRNLAVNRYIYSDWFFLPFSWILLRWKCQSANDNYHLSWNSLIEF